MVEPRFERPTGSANLEDVSDSEHEQDLGGLWTIVDECRHERDPMASKEPCRFCGNVFGSWKKLASHTSKHMELLAMSVLAVVNQYPKAELAAFEGSRE